MDAGSQAERKRLKEIKEQKKAAVGADAATRAKKHEHLAKVLRRGQRGPGEDRFRWCEWCSEVLLRAANSVTV